MHGGRKADVVSPADPRREAPKMRLCLFFLHRHTEREKKKKKESHPNQFSSTQLIKMDIADKTGNESHSIFYSVCMDTVNKNTPVK